MKPFNLEKARNGNPVCFKDGSPVRIICWDREHPTEKIVFLWRNDSIGIEQIEYCGEDGAYTFENHREPYLFMVPKKKVFWVNYYAGPTLPTNGLLGDIFSSEEEAYQHGQAQGHDEFVKIISFEVEE